MDSGHKETANLGGTSESPTDEDSVGSCNEELGHRAVISLGTDSGTFKSFVIIIIIMSS